MHQLIKKIIYTVSLILQKIFIIPTHFVILKKMDLKIPASVIVLITLNQIIAELNSDSVLFVSKYFLVLLFLDIYVLILVKNHTFVVYAPKLFHRNVIYLDTGKLILATDLINVIFVILVQYRRSI